MSAGLGGAVVGHPWRAEDARRRGGVDDAAEVLLPHGLPRGPGDEERTLEVDIHQWGQQFLGHIVEAASLTVPALLTRMSTRPQVSSAVSMIAWPPSGVATLLVSATASPPLVPDLLRGVVGGITAGAVPGHRAAEIVDDDARPRSARRSAYCLPRPRPAPVTTATCRRTAIHSSDRPILQARCVNWIGTARGSLRGFGVDIASIISGT